MNDIIIEIAKNEDKLRIIEFEKKSRITEPGILYWDIDEEYINKLTKLDIENIDNSKIIVARQNNNILGRCDVSIIFSLVNFEKVGYIDWIYTLKDYRGKGIGKKLLKYAEEYFRRSGVKYFFLMTASNEQSQEFYHRQTDLKFYNREVAEKDIK